MKDINEKKSFWGRFVEWLREVDEDYIKDGELNISAFNSERPNTIKELNKTGKNVNDMGEEIFKDREEKRRKTKSRIKVEVQTPNISKENSRNKDMELEMEQE